MSGECASLMSTATERLLYTPVSGDAPSETPGRSRYKLPGRCVSFEYSSFRWDDNIFHRLDAYYLDLQYRGKTSCTNPKTWDFSKSQEMQIPVALAQKIESIADAVLTHNQKYPPLEEPGELLRTAEALRRQDLSREEAIEEYFRNRPASLEEFQSAEQGMADETALRNLKNKIGAEFHQFAIDQGIIGS